MTSTERNGSLFLETGESHMAFCPVLHHMTSQCRANFLNLLQSENIGVVCINDRGGGGGILPFRLGREACPILVI